MSDLSIKSAFDYYVRDDEIKGWLTMGDLDEFHKWTEEDAKVLQASAYCGCDPLEIFKIIVKNVKDWESKNPTPKTYSVVDTQKRVLVSFTTHLSPLTYMKTATIIFNTRGNSLDKMKDKSHEGFPDLVEMLIAAIGIDDTKRESGDSVGRDVITWPRVSMVFPKVAMNMAKRGLGKIYITPEEMGFPEGTSAAISHTNFVNFLPKFTPAQAQGKKYPHVVFMLPHIALDNTIHRKPGESKTKLDQIAVYYLASYHTPIINQKARLAEADVHRLLNEDKSWFSDEVMALVDNAEEWIKTNRPDEVFGPTRKMLEATFS